MDNTHIYTKPFWYVSTTCVESTHAVWKRKIHVYQKEVNL